MQPDKHKRISNGSLVMLYGGYTDPHECLALVVAYMGKNTYTGWPYSVNHTYRVILLADAMGALDGYVCGSYAHTEPASKVFLRIVKVIVEM